MSPPPQHGVFLDLGSIDRGDMDLSRLQEACPRWDLHPATRPEQTAERIAGADLVVTNKVVFGRDLILGARSLRLICVAATGTNNVDLETARESGVAVRNVTGYATPSVVQHVFALMLAHFTRLPAWLASVRAGDWSRSEHFCLLDHPIEEVAGQTIGIVGLGELGRGVAGVAAAMGMRVLVAQRPGGDPSPDRLPLPELLPMVDVLTLHCPLTERTRGLIGAAELALMKPDALLINTARGGIVDELALVDALRAGRLGGAAFDVLTGEPPPETHPLLAADVPNLLVTPHVAWASRAARQRLLDATAENVRRFCED